MKEEQITDDIVRYNNMLPLEPKAFGFDNVNRIVVYNTTKNQYIVLGSYVYTNMDAYQRDFLNRVSYIYNIYLTSENGDKFNYIEKIDDYYIGCTYDNGLLIFIKQKEWNSKDDLVSSFKRLSTIIKNDYSNLFI